MTHAASEPASPTMPGAEELAHTAAAVEHMASAAVRTWIEEGVAFWSDKARDDAQALAALNACRSPLDLFAVEQNWIAARTSAYIDAGVRLLTGACKQAEQAAADAASVKLPE